MKEALVYIGILITSISCLSGQCNFQEKLNIDVDLANCFSIVDSLLVNNSNDDTLALKLTYYKILCDKMNLNQICESINSSIEIERKIYSNKDDKNARYFLRKNSNQIRLIKIKIYELAYNRSIAQNDFYNASKFAGELSRLNRTEKLKEEWKRIEQNHYQKYAGANHLELLKFHSSFLMKDTCTQLHYLDSLGYDYLIKLVKRNNDKIQFKQNLIEAIELSYLVEKPNNSFETEYFGGLSSYFLTFNLEGTKFEFLNRRISRLYHYDAIYEIPTTSYVWGDNGCHEVKGTYTDTIVNKIDNFLEIDEYRSTFTGTYFYEIIRRIND